MANKEGKLSKEQLAVIEHRKRIFEEADVKGFVKRIQKFEDEIAVEKYGKKFYELPKTERREVSIDAVEKETREMLIWGRSQEDRNYFEKLSFEELLEAVKK
ncbi:MAG: hypothetical protein NTZ75_03055 [Euryarchaeota archaeon]|nr:hypothetical protein [Euryarchaeota archaeon]